MRIRVLLMRIRVPITAFSAQISKRKEDISGSNAILVLLHGQVPSVLHGTCRNMQHGSHVVRPCRATRARKTPAAVPLDRP